MLRKHKIIIMLLSFLFIVILLVQPLVGKTNNNTIIVKVDGLNVRSGPSIDYNIIATLKKDDSYTIIEEENNWYKIDLENNEGWVAGWLVELTESIPLQSSTSIILADVLNVRSAPSIDSKIVGRLYRNDEIEIIEVVQDWYKITSKDTIGWIASEFANIKNPEENLNKPTVTILEPGTNLRNGPSTSQPVVSIVNIGDQFPIIETEGDWYQVLLPDGTKAYVAGWIVSTTGIEKNIEHGMDVLLKNRTIVIDAGHGGNDYGATGVSFNTIEKDLNLSIALNLQKKLQATGAKVIMTRDTDTKISLQQRIDSAIFNNADAFISIHHNTNIDNSLNGTITYYHKNSDKQLAQVIHNELIKYTNLNDLNTRYGDYFVLRENPKPSILIELAFITNYHDELKVNSEKFQENAAEGIFQGLVKYFSAK